MLNIGIVGAENSHTAAIAKVLNVEKRLSSPLYSVSTLSVLNRQGLEALEQQCYRWFSEDCRPY